MIAQVDEAIAYLHTLTSRASVALPTEFCGHQLLVDSFTYGFRKKRVDGFGDLQLSMALRTLSPT